MSYPCDTCYHKFVCKHCDEMRDFIKELDTALQGIVDKHPSLNIVNAIKPMERICTRYSASPDVLKREMKGIQPLRSSSDEFGTFYSPSKEDADK